MKNSDIICKNLRKESKFGNCIFRFNSFNGKIVKYTIDNEKDNCGQYLQVAVVRAMVSFSKNFKII